jgi:hypothetical protein
MLEHSYTPVNTVVTGLKYTKQNLDTQRRPRLVPKHESFKPIPTKLVALTLIWWLRSCMKSDHLILFIPAVFDHGSVGIVAASSILRLSFASSDCLHHLEGLNGLLNPPFLFMYCLYSIVLFFDTA